jgi:hypothetical protein
VAAIKADDPQVPGEADLVFVCDVLHHVSDRAGWLRKTASEMKPGARFVLIEFKEGKLPEGPPEATKIPRKQLIELVSQAGLPFESEKPDLLPYQVFLVFRKGTLKLPLLSGSWLGFVEAGASGEVEI